MKCPTCGSTTVYPAASNFMCSNHHLFSWYKEEAKEIPNLWTLNPHVDPVGVLACEEVAKLITSPEYDNHNIFTRKEAHDLAIHSAEAAVMRVVRHYKINVRENGTW